MSDGYDPRAGRAAGIVDDAAGNLEQPLGDRCKEQARQIAKETELHKPINRAPSAVAAASVYIATVLNCEKQKQEHIAEAFGVSAVTVRNNYKEMLGLESDLVRQQVVGRITAAQLGCAAEQWHKSRGLGEGEVTDDRTPLVQKLLSEVGGR